MSALWEIIDLGRHGVIEAHAGTGKTFTIVKLVLRILQRETADATGTTRRIHVREILLVTFTEKAAGELKKRIREELEDTIALLSPDNPLYGHLKSCLNALHEALIGTIHSVCLRLLRTWPFESGVNFDTEIVDDMEGCRSALRESMRTDWQEEERRIPWALQRMAETGFIPDEKQFGLISATAKELLDDEFTHLDRIVTGGRTLTDLHRESGEINKEKDGHRGHFNDLLQTFAAALGEVKKSGSLTPDRGHLCQLRIDECREMIQSGSYQIKTLERPLKFGARKIFGKNDVGKISGTKAAADCVEPITGHPFLRLLRQEISMQRSIPLALIGDAAELASGRWAAVKNANGFLSFQDILRYMHRAVTGHPAFPASLGKMVRYAIIDEFQDTSRLQWEVFRKLFVGAEGADAPRLYIVGDPKQSIYAFRGADVNSYLDARGVIKENGGERYALGNNYRSLDATVEGYNRVFIADEAEENWFLFNDATAGIQYPSGQAVSTPQRDKKPNHPLPFPPLQILALEGTQRQRLREMACTTARAIERLVGTSISVPKGTGWNDLQLAYNDFAIIVEVHRDAQPFLDELRRRKIPAVKYKMEGVFQSPMARALHALLGALLSPSGKPGPRLAALLTPFFNRKPEAIDPDHDLEPCENPSCKGDSLCMAHALEEWSGFAARSFWAQLFESIQRLTGIRERLLRLSDGERHLADLRQVIDYCMECLYQKNYTLPHLTEHLKSLLDEETSVGQDRNLHVLETEKSSVRVLTMHAAKGLEFPVVFVVTGASAAVRKGPNFVRYCGSGDDADEKVSSVSVVPYLHREDITNAVIPERMYLQQAGQERRRLLYVALTRAQALLFVPMHLKKLPEKPGSVPWSSLQEGVKYDVDLTRKLLTLLDTAEAGGPIALFDENNLPPVKSESGTGTHSQTATTVHLEALPDIPSLRLLSRICRQTSYSQLSREAYIARSVDKSEEVDEPEAETTDAPNTPSALPGGTTTGDALHCALEDILRADDVLTIVNDPETVRSMVTKYLKRNGILARLYRLSSGSEEAIRNAVTTACNCITGALTTTLALPRGSTLDGVATLSRKNRLPEMEFLLGIGPHWVHGFMDLVFRISIENKGKQDWRYYVLDWKSDTLPHYDGKTIYDCIGKRHYDLQAQLYSHALDRYLSGILRSSYDPSVHLGGAVYLFLREHERMLREQATVWTYAARPDEDAGFVYTKVKAGS